MRSRTLRTRLLCCRLLESSWAAATGVEPGAVETSRRAVVEDRTDVQVPMTGHVQGNFGFPDKGKGILDAAVCVTPLSCQSPSFSSVGDSFLDSEPSNSDEGLDFFAGMDDESSEEDLDFFVALDIASATEAKTSEGPSSGAPLTVGRGKRRRVGIPKRRGGSIEASTRGRGGGRKRRRMGLGGLVSRISLREVLGMGTSHFGGGEVDELDMGPRHAVLMGVLSGFLISAVTKSRSLGYFSKARNLN